MKIQGIPSRHGARFILVILAVLLSACAAKRPAPPDAPVELPLAFAAAGEAQAGSEQWWLDFADERLDAFVEDALVNSPALGQAIARVRIAQAQARIQGADRLPQVGAGLSSARQRQNLSASALPLPLGEGDDVRFISDNHSATLDIRWEVDLWGRLSLLSAAGRADFLAADEQLRAMRQSITAQVVRLYFGVVHARAQLALSRDTVRTLAEMARQIDNRVRVGIASPSDGMLANANLESARAGLEQRREALARSLRQLEVLMGDYPDGTLATARALPQVPPPPPAGVPAELLARRPDVLAAEWSLHAAGYRRSAAQRSFLPAITLTGSAGSSSSEFADLFGSGTFVWSIAGNVLQPVFQGGRLRAQVDLASGQRDEALQRYAETALTALAEVETALAVDDYLAHRETALDVAASAAEEAVQVSLNRYLQGIDPFLNVLESQQRALDSRSAHISARHARLENRIDLHLALGGGFEDSPLPVSSTTGK